MYVVNIKNGSEVIPIHNLKNKLWSGNVVQGINTIDSFQFSILSNNPGFGKLKEFTTLVEVINTSKNRTEFYGRVLSLSPEMNDKGLIFQSVVCESYFGFLCDSQQRYVAKRKWTVNQLFEQIISWHNSQVEEYKKFRVVIDESLRYLEVYEDIQRENTWDAIKKKLLDKVGGEIVLYATNGEHVINYSKKAGATKTTKIAISKNMKSIKQEKDPSTFITRLIPLGAKLNDDTEERLEIDVKEDLTIVDSNNGMGIIRMYKGKKYIDHVPGVQNYGLHVGYVEFDDVTNATDLLQKSWGWIVDNNKVKVKYSITALDLSLIGLDIDDFQIFNRYPIYNNLLDIDDIGRIIKKNINVCEEVRSSFEIGDEFKTLSALQSEQKEYWDKLGDKIASIKKDAFEAIKNSGFVTEEKVNELINSNLNNGGETCAHEWGAWFTEQVSTCITKGRAYRICNKCSEYGYKQLPLASHAFGTDNICDVCGYKECEHENAISTIAKEATCYSAGLEYVNCPECNKQFEKILEPLPHTYGTDNICDVCGYVPPPDENAGEDGSKIETDGDITYFNFDMTYLHENNQTSNPEFNYCMIYFETSNYSPIIIHFNDVARYDTTVEIKARFTHPIASTATVVCTDNGSEYLPYYEDDYEAVFEINLGNDDNGSNMASYKLYFGSEDDKHTGAAVHNLVIKTFSKN